VWLSTATSVIVKIASKTFLLILKLFKQRKNVIFVAKLTNYSKKSVIQLFSYSIIQLFKT